MVYISLYIYHFVYISMRILENLSLLYLLQMSEVSGSIFNALLCVDNVVLLPKNKTLTYIHVRSDSIMIMVVIT